MAAGYGRAWVATGVCAAQLHQRQTKSRRCTSDAPRKRSASSRNRDLPLVLMPNDRNVDPLTSIHGNDGGPPLAEHPQGWGGRNMRVLVIADSNDRIDPAVAALRQAGIDSVQEMEGALGLLRRVADFQPDIILIDTASPSRDVLESLCVVNSHAPRPMVMFTNDDSDASISAAMAAGVTIYSVEGIDASKLPPIMRIAAARFRQDQQWSTKLDAIEHKQRERQSVDTAKGLLMARDGLNEANAYRKLRNTAMKDRRSLVEVATELLKRWQS